MTPFGVEFIVDVKQMHGEDPSYLDIIEDSLTSPSPASSEALNYSSATQFSRSFVVPLACVPKLETHVATLLQHVNPWIQHTIEESKAMVE